ncbi:MAG: POT family proton-dependent oligopeptide transporter [Bradymonadia bacterium]|jgi:POT family proton-dependent oligopeptide transporter
MTSGLPKGIPYIIGNEAAERFSFYGMKGILVVFMTQFLFLLPGAADGDPMARATAVEHYHAFTSLVYFTPILGALLADILLGKYLTIMSLSLVYCAGHAVLAMMGISDAIDPAKTMWMGLILIALGSGGIKPCVSAHVGDQFGPGNKQLLTKVFGWFYFSINTGAFLSTMLTPWLLEWYGPHYAFGIPGILMAIATFAFWKGRNVFVHIPPSGKRWFDETFSPVGLKAMAKVSVVFLFIAVFWALFDQTGSSWVLQAEDMDRYWLGRTWLSSQIQAVNPIMILVFIPTFQFIVYPAINKFWKLTPMRKISLGLFVMVGGFAMVAYAQGLIDAGQRPSIGWQVSAYAILTASEVMVSITGLEFAYTQAPKTMKSVIMALFLMSVSLGNIFTATVNNNIVVDSGSEAAMILAAEFAEFEGTEGRAALAEAAGIGLEQREDGSFSLILPGFSDAANDDIEVLFGADGNKEGMSLSESEALHQGLAQIEAYWNAEDRLPLTEDGAELVATVNDPWGNPLRYQLINRQNFIISSDGPDDEQHTLFDAWIEVSVSAMSVQSQEEAVAQAGSATADSEVRYTWVQTETARMALNRAMAEDGTASLTLEDFLPAPVAAEGVEIAAQPFVAEARPYVGGATTLRGAPYFWFFTRLMAGTAIAFVIVAFLYKPKEYIQGDDGNDTGPKAPAAA